MDERRAAIAAAIAAHAGPVPAESTCEIGHCAILLDVAYGRLVELNRATRLLIHFMLGFYGVQILAPGPYIVEGVCELCAGLTLIDDTSWRIPYLPCSIGKCALVNRRGTWLEFLPRDLWLTIVRYNVYMCDRERASKYVRWIEEVRCSICK